MFSETMWEEGPRGAMDYVFVSIVMCVGGDFSSPLSLSPITILFTWETKLHCKSIKTYLCHYMYYYLEYAG